MAERPLLAALPNGEAIRPHLVRAIRIEPAPALLEEAGERFCVVIELVDGERRIVATGLSRADAADMGRRCARAINDGVRG